MYWFTRLDPMRDLIGSASVICLITFVVMFVAYPILCEVFEYDEGMKKKSIAWTAWSHIAVLVVAVMSALAYAMIPTTKEMAAIKVVPMIANSESVKKLGDVGNNMLDLANEWLVELKPKKGE